MKTQKILTKARRLVIKIGSALITRDGAGLDDNAIQQWAEQISALKKAGCQPVLVSSGSVAEGMVRLGWKQRPHALHELQAAAARQLPAPIRSTCPLCQWLALKVPL